MAAPVVGQSDFSFVIQPHCIYSRNLGVVITSAFEYILLDAISIAGITNFSVIVKNNSNVGNITNVTVYSTPNGIDYIPIVTDLFKAYITPNTTQYKEFVAVSRFLRITVQSDSNINLDLHLNGNLT